MMKYIFTFITILFLLGCAAKDINTIDSSLGARELYERGMRFYQNGMYENAEDAFKLVMEEYPLSGEALDSQLMLGDVYYAMERYEEAASYYTSFSALHPSHPRAPYALFQKGMSHFKEVLSIDRDQTSTKKALFAFEDLIRTYPDSPYVAKSRELISFLRRRLAESEFYVGQFYFKNKNYRGALYRFREILKNYPDVGLTDKTLYYIGMAYTLLGEEELARDTFSTLISEFPESPFSKDARSELKGS